MYIWVGQEIQVCVKSAIDIKTEKSKYIPLFDQHFITRKSAFLRSSLIPF